MEKNLNTMMYKILNLKWNTMKKTIFTTLIFFLTHNLHAAEAPRTIKVPPPVILPAVPRITGFASTFSYITDDKKYRVTIDRNANTVTIYDISDLESPVLISVNEYETKKKSDAE